MAAIRSAATSAASREYLRKHNRLQPFNRTASRSAHLPDDRGPRSPCFLSLAVRVCGDCRTGRSEPDEPNDEEKKATHNTRP
jgi:hypothetical protein